VSACQNHLFHKQYFSIVPVTRQDSTCSNVDVGAVDISTRNG